MRTPNRRDLIRQLVANKPRYRSELVFGLRRLAHGEELADVYRKYRKSWGVFSEKTVQIHNDPGKQITLGASRVVSEITYALLKCGELKINKQKKLYATSKLRKKYGGK